jgi:hypothetical protein
VSNDLKDFQEFLETAESTHKSDVANRKAGIVLVTAREAGIFFGPETKPSLMNKKMCRLPTAAEWQESYQVVLAKITTFDVGQPATAKPQTFNPSITIERT